MSPRSEVARSIQTYFDRACDHFGDSHHSVGWYNRKTQQIRFAVLNMIGNLDSHSVLDIGCGLGDLVEFFEAAKLKPRYTGIDLSPKMIHLAKDRHPQYHFETRDFLEDSFSQTYDYILASGAFSFRVPDRDQYIKTAVRKMFTHARKGVAFNLLSSRAPQHLRDDKAFHYYDPQAILSICFAITPYVTINHAYLPNDFTVFMYK